MNWTAEEFIERLSLTPHPEGGWFQVRGRSGADTERAGVLEGLRESCSCIYYLLRRNEISRWHRLVSSEVWTWHAGGSMLMTLGGSGTLPLAGKTQALGTRLDQGEQFNMLVPPNQWQTTRVIAGDFALVSCIVAPAYEDTDCLLPEKPLPNEIYSEEGGANHDN